MTNETKDNIEKLTAFGESITFVVQKNSLVHPDTVAARNFLLLHK